MQNLRFIFSAIAAIAFAAAPAAALDVPFEEDFDADAAGWLDNASNPADWFAAGGPDGSAFASADLNFSALSAGNTPVVLRGPSTASGGAFAGDWISGGVSSFKVQFRHDGPAPIIPFVRFASPFNFPGAVTLGLAPVAANEWAEIAVRISEDNPILNFEGSDFNSVFSDIGRVQIGVLVDDTLAGLDQNIRFDIDKARLIPAPGAMATLGLAGLAAARRRRR